MRSSVIWSFLSVVALSVGGLISGCDNDATIAKSGEGESCDSAADCSEGYKCLQGACYKKAAPVDGGAGEGNATGGTTSGPPEPVLGDEGESCTKRADCADGLGCFNQRCIAAPAGEGGEGNIPGGPVLGKNGETCQTSADCEMGLGCLPGGIGSPAPVGYLGVCTKSSGSLTPTGKNCNAECVEAVDCCELPLALHIAFGAAVPGVSAPYGTGAQSCAELADLIGASKCTAAATGVLAARCFAQAAYCGDECGDSWTCDAGICNYAAACTKTETLASALVGGCPDFSRSGKAFSPYCNADGACAPDAVVVKGCKKDADCDGGTTADTAENCTDGECTCYKATGACYRRCTTNLDCPVSAPVTGANTVCETATSVCVPAEQCTTNEQCAVQMGSTKFTCVENTCVMRCDTDYDCNPGAITSINSTVCVDHVCAPIGCSDDVQCSSAPGVTGVRMFCTTPEPVVPGATVYSAITD